MLNKVPTRQRNALDLIVWKNHERAKWLRYGIEGWEFHFDSKIG
jgi:hypothetical protein